MARQRQYKPLVFPFGGRSDSTSHTEHPELYAEQARNVRGRDPTTGRVRGARRSGMSKFNASPLGSGRVKALCSTSFDTRQVEYDFTAGSESLAWKKSTPAKTDCFGGATDSKGNIYALNGPAGITKYNSAGAEIFSIKLPTADKAHVCRAIHVDEFDRIYVAVSSGGEVATARMWCIVQEPQEQKNQADETEYFILWQHEPGAFTEEVKVVKGLLYAAHNFEKERRARVYVYDDIGVLPRITQRIETVTYPINGMDVGADGSVYTTSPSVSAGETAGSLRPGHPASPKNHAPVVGWTPLDLADAKRRIWSWYDADSIDDTDLESEAAGLDLKDNSGGKRQVVLDKTVGPFGRFRELNPNRILSPEEIDTLSTGREVLRWRDKSGHDRHLYAGTKVVSTEKGPVYSKVGVGGLPSVRFINAGTTFKSSLVSEANISINVALADQQRGIVPAYEGGMGAMFILMRPTLDADITTPSPRLVFYGDNQAAGPAVDHSLWVNRTAAVAVPSSYTKGFVSYATATDATGDGGGGGGAPPQLRDYDFNSNDQGTGCVLVTILWDGAVEPNDTSKTRCLFRVNGVPIDRCEGLAFTSLKEQWLGYSPSLASTSELRFNGEICEIIVLDRKNRLSNTEPKVATHDQLEIGSGATNQTDNEVAQIEAYMLGKRGLLSLLQNSGSFPNFYSRTAVGTTSPTVPKPIVAGRDRPRRALVSTGAVVLKHSPPGDLKWTYPNVDLDFPTSDLLNGYGYGVRARTMALTDDTKTYVWITGPGTPEVRKFEDLGDAFDQPAATSWSHTFTNSSDPDYQYLRMATDKFGNLFYPYYETAASEWSLLVLAKAPSATTDAYGGSTKKATVLVDFLLPNSIQAHAVALPPDSLTPDYRNDLTTKLAEKVTLFARQFNTSTDTESVFHIRAVTIQALTSGLPRDVITLGVVGADIKTITALAVATPTGGSGAIDSGSPLVQCVRAGDDIVIVDGTRYKAYSLRTGVVSTLESTSTGEIPPLAQLAMFWRHRLVLGRFADNAGGYAASKLGDIRNWNFFPATVTSTTAFRGATTRAGEAEDALVAMIPVWDDLAYLISESRILRITGDPQDGGSIHKVTDSLGGVLGDSWCVDTVGRVFMFGNSPPGLYMLPPAEDPIPLTRHSLEESEFANIDFSTHRIVLAWNPIDRGVHIWQVAWFTNALVNHWFWEEKTHHFISNPPLWQDRFYSKEKQPVCASYLAGDDTRCLLIGCEDGYVRKWDPAADTDDGDPIDGYFMSKVSPGGGPGVEWLVKAAQITLADDQGGARFELFASETADSPGPIQFSAPLGPGLNEEFRVRLKGNHIWARVRSAASSRWAYEAGGIEIVPRGKLIPASP